MGSCGPSLDDRLLIALAEISGLMGLHFFFGENFLRLLLGDTDFSGFFGPASFSYRARVACFVSVLCFRILTYNLSASCC